MNNIFVLYDRNSDSVWYPDSEEAFEAVSGPAKGTKLPFLVEPEVMRLHAWAELHPETLVLLPPEPGPAQIKQQEQRMRARKILPGRYEMASDMGGQSIEAEMKIEAGRRGFQGTWTSQGQDMEMSRIWSDGVNFSFSREIPSGETLIFRGTIDEEKVTGKWFGPFGEIPCEGRKIKE